MVPKSIFSQQTEVADILIIILINRPAQDNLDQASKFPLQRISPYMYLHTPSASTMCSYHLCVLKGSLWSRIIGLSHGIGTATLLTAGCYLFSIVPSASLPERMLPRIRPAISTSYPAFKIQPQLLLALEDFMNAPKNESDMTRCG